MLTGCYMFLHGGKCRNNVPETQNYPILGEIMAHLTTLSRKPDKLIENSEKRKNVCRNLFCKGFEWVEVIPLWLQLQVPTRDGAASLSWHGFDVKPSFWLFRMVRTWIFDYLEWDSCVNQQEPAVKAVLPEQQIVFSLFIITSSSVSMQNRRHTQIKDIYSAKGAGGLQSWRRWAACSSAVAGTILFFFFLDGFAV